MDGDATILVLYMSGCALIAVSGNWAAKAKRQVLTAVCGLSLILYGGGWIVWAGGGRADVVYLVGLLPVFVGILYLGVAALLGNGSEPPLESKDDDT